MTKLPNYHFILPQGVERLIDLALEEDLSSGDVTSEAIFSYEDRSKAYLLAKQAFTLCGMCVARRVMERVEPSAVFLPMAADGQHLEPDTRFATIEASTLAILRAERTMLNFLQRLSGVATQSARFAAVVHGMDVRVVDTRKTTPGWRVLEKYAVRVGGCHNHRTTLGEHVLIKDNHIAAAGSVHTAIERCRKHAPHLAKIACEVTNLQELSEALEAGVDVVLLDNFTPAAVDEAVKLVGGRALVEVSGGVTFETLPAYVAAKPDVISVGALTHGARAVDISLEIEKAS
jgi:nicotinate-nucleotide pyrophosphorylase (carboxylating)